MIVAATGHRPDKLGGHGPEPLGALVQIASEYLADVQPEGVISGMALGWDTAIALAALGAGYPLTAAVPCDGHERIWPADAQEMHRQIISAATRVVVVSPGLYAPWKMQARNVWMVDRCDLLIVLWSGANGGTAACVNYAKKSGRPWVNLWDRFVGVQ